MDFGYVLDELEDISYENTSFLFRSEISNGCAIAWSKLGNEERATLSFEKALRSITRIDEADPSEWLLKSMAVEWIRAIQFSNMALERAYDITSRIRKNNLILVYTLNQMAELLSNMDHRSEANEAIERALELLDTVETDSDRSFVMVRLANTLPEFGRITEAEDMLTGAVRSAAALNDVTDRNYVMRSIVKVWGRIGEIRDNIEDIKKGLAVIDGINDDYYRSGVLTHLALSLGKMGKIEEMEMMLERSLRTIGSMDPEINGRSSTWALLSIANVCYEFDRWGRMRKTLDEAVLHAKSILNPWQRSSAIWNIIDTILGMNEKPEGAKLLDIAADMAKNIPDTGCRARALCRIADEHVNRNNVEKGIELLDEAERLIGTMDDRIAMITRSMAARELARAWAHAGARTGKEKLILRAIEIVEKIPDGQSALGLVDIAGALFEMARIKESERNIIGALKYIESMECHSSRAPIMKGVLSGIQDMIDTAIEN